MQESIKAAEPMLPQDVEWAVDSWVKTRGPSQGEWRQDWDELEVIDWTAKCIFEPCKG